MHRRKKRGLTWCVSCFHALVCETLRCLCLLLYPGATFIVSPWTFDRSLFHLLTQISGRRRNTRYTSLYRPRPQQSFALIHRGVISHCAGRQLIHSRLESWLVIIEISVPPSPRLPGIRVAQARIDLRSDRRFTSSTTQSPRPCDKIQSQTASQHNFRDTNGSVEQKDILRRERAIEGRKSGVETGVAEEDKYALEKVTVANSVLVLSSWVSTVSTAWALLRQWAIPMASRLSSPTKVSCISAGSGQLTTNPDHT